MSPIPLGTITLVASLLTEALATLAPVALAFVKDESERGRVAQGVDLFVRFVRQGAQKLGPLADALDDPSTIDVDAWFGQSFDEVVAELKAKQT